MNEELPPQEAIAVIGMAGRFPGADSPDEFWANLIAGKDCITRFEPRVGSDGAEYVGAALEPQSANSPLAGVGPADLYNRCPRDLPLVASGATVLGDGVLALAPQGAAHPKVIFCQLAPWQFDATHDRSQKAARRRSAVLLGRLLANLGAAGETPLPDRFQKPPAPDEQPRWLRGLYSDVPEEWDDPYRFFRW